MRRSRLLLAVVLAVGGLTHAAEPTAPLLTLDEAIQRALAHNPRLKVESYSRAIARAQVLAAYGRFDPALNFRRSYTDDEAPDLLATGGGPRTFTRDQTDAYSLTLDGQLPWGLTYSAGGTARNSRGTANAFRDNYATTGSIFVRQPLLRGFGFANNLSGLRLAKADRTIADWDFRDIVSATVTQVITAYYDLSFARENLRAAQRTREQGQQLLRDNTKRFEQGVISEGEVVEVQANLARREEEVASAERAVRASDYQLRQLLGDQTVLRDTAAVLTVEPPSPAEFVTVSAADDLPRALAQRPDYQIARTDVQRRRIGDRAARNELLPSVAFEGRYGYNGYDDRFATSRRLLRDQDYRSYSAGVVVNVPLTLAAERGRARAARLALQQAEARRTQAEQEIAVALANAADQITTTQQRVEATRTALALARQVLENDMKRLRAGTRDTFFVLQRQDSLSLAEIRFYRACVDHRKALAAYDRETGRTLERHHITLAAE